jgi:hypothetical protein
MPAERAQADEGGAILKGLDAGSKSSRVNPLVDL